jgi:hypothetical protein
MTIAGLTLALASLGVFLDASLLLMNLVGLTDAVATPTSDIAIRMGVGVLWAWYSALILRGANNMRQQKDLRAARRACLFAMIPFAGPCFLLGIPVGFWGLYVLSREPVRARFS